MSRDLPGRVVRAGWLPFLAAFLIACGGDGSTQADQSLPADPLDQMAIAFEGGHSRQEIKTRLDQAMELYGLPPTDDNYSRAGSVLVSLRRDLGPEEMEILDYMIRSHVPGVAMDFPSMAGISAAALASGDR